MRQTRNTAQRKLILDIMENSPTHPTADEVYDLARSIEPRISRGTVYRNLNLLSSTGEICKLPMPSGPDHFDHKLDSHYHFLCRECCKVTNANLSYYDFLNEASACLPGYRTEWHRLILIGLCPDCIEG